MFVKYECGCIGFPPDEHGDAIIVQCCDNDGERSISFFRRCMKNNNGEVRSFTPLTETGEGIVLTDIQRVIAMVISFTNFVAS